LRGTKGGPRKQINGNIKELIERNKEVFMKRFLLILFSLLLVVGVGSNAYATLTTEIDGSEYAVFDDTTGQYWYYYLDDMVLMDYSQQNTFITGLNTGTYFGFDTWHMADAAEITGLQAYALSDIASNFNNSMFPVWLGRYDDPFYDSEMNLFHNTFGILDNFGLYVDISGDIIATGSAPDTGAWVTTNPIPEPATLLLLGSGLLGVAGVRRRKKR